MISLFFLLHGLTSTIAALRDATLLSLGGGIGALPWISVASAVLGLCVLNPWAAVARSSVSSLRTLLRCTAVMLAMFAAAYAAGGVDQRTVGALCAVLDNVCVLASSLLWMSARTTTSAAANHFVAYATACSAGKATGLAVAWALGHALQVAAAPIGPGALTAAVCALFAFAALILEATRHLLWRVAEGAPRRARRGSPRSHSACAATALTSTSAFALTLGLFSLSYAFNAGVLRAEKLALVGRVGHARIEGGLPAPPLGDSALLLRSFASLVRINLWSAAATLAVQLALARSARAALDVPALLMVLPSIDVGYAVWRLWRGAGGVGASANAARLATIATLESVRSVVAYAFLKAAREELYIALPPRCARRTKIYAGEAARRLAGPAAALLAGGDVAVLAATCGGWLVCAATGTQFAWRRSVMRRVAQGGEVRI